MSNTKPQPTTSKDWRERFEAEFGKFSVSYNKKPLTYKKIESFIQQEIDKAVKAERERCLAEFENAVDSKYPLRFINVNGNVGEIERGVVEETYVRRLESYDKKASVVIKLIY